MRLVSTYYEDHYPFNTFNLFNSFLASNNPGILQQGDVLLVWGGRDIPPQYYGRSHSRFSGAAEVPTTRDTIEWNMMQRAKELKIPIIGVCRGAQMLCALAGGHLMQHISGHAGPNHTIVTPDGKEYWVNSLHHQMMVPGPAAHEILGQVPVDNLRSKVYIDEHQEVDHKQEPEMVWFNDVNGLAIQWHPEMQDHKALSTLYIKEVVKERIIEDH